MQLCLRVLVIASVLGQAFSNQLQRRATEPPSCSVDCMETLVPEYCGSLTNTTCICTDTSLTAELTVCALAACNITEAFQLKKYQAESCGVANEQSRLNEQYTVYKSVPALVTLFFFARIYTRITLEKLGIDDWVMVAAFIFYWIDMGCGLAMVSNNFGQHTYWLSTKQVESGLMYFYICELWYLITITLTKVSLLLFFRRIFPQRTFGIATWVVLAYTATSSFGVLMGLTFQCVPFRATWTNWEYKVAPVKCINLYALVYFAAANSIFQDIMILAMPLPILLKLNLGWMKKANLLVMFSIGLFVVLCSALRLPSLVVLSKSSDPSWDQAPIGLWTTLEESVGIICACLPACRNLIGHLFPSLRTGGGASGSSHTPRKYPGGLATIGSKPTRTADSSFMELRDQNMPGRINNNSDEWMNTVHSHDSKAPICGASTDIHADAAAASVKGQGIVMTMEVDQRRHER